MITGKWFPPGARPDEAALIWEETFGSADGSIRVRDNLARVACLRDDCGQCVAAVRLYYADGAYWIDSLAVRECARGQGYGDLLIRMALDMALTHGARAIRLESPRGCAAFFQRYGFYNIDDIDIIEGVSADSAASIQRASLIQMEAMAGDVRLSCAASRSASARGYGAPAQTIRAQYNPQGE
ncbi:MAG: GNAT family N-acetyltransferase [Oscillospiraceae bacterium]|jgi:predicted N-acetyltransferase YhbS|nr:GNAT family N-acetyltransferase [Oscillospiraceae bacterium]